jgi:DNA-binding NtrC family response regulator
MDQKKVLIVDDEIHIVHVVAIKLKNNGYEVISANNGAELMTMHVK